MVRQHLKSCNQNVAGPLVLTGENQAAATQAASMFINIPSVKLQTLAVLLQQAERDA